MKYVKLNSGDQMPLLGLGTWQLRGQECTDSVKEAIDIGYNHIDTADGYDNHQAVAKGIKESGVNREDLFITSKIKPENLHYEDIKADTQRFLDELGIEYLDLILIHWPNKDIPLEESLKALKEVKEEGLAKNIGVSNFTVNHLKDAIEIEPDLVAVNQVEFHPTLYQKDLLDFCQENGIVLTAYSPLARGEIFENEVIKELADKYEKSASKLALKWLIEKDVVAIPKASSRAHLESNFDLFDWELPTEVVDKMDQLNQNNRLIDPDWGEFDY
ncbi:diketogulonate reductase-like aldo/keto reductase [Halanaerobium saccharolyticum]|uniref:Diketogulonate reductase-like aldo/keto reductase n=1 Tax=Halanaerobium saccharolyticum TaxID=43595 RepID=A0A2T5RJ47_9FIRM|nr:aldo/keto reductase [Halanaerobium saccharolyticum]PTV98504.1 diketogulonate reductase-like aldo/keto reductase [Halanaerobium saccharolyticum]TDQ06161.1 diketogulonate reductase-like aldo/keto reductase [Halanaerobium saccharolyticum]